MRTSLTFLYVTLGLALVAFSTPAHAQWARGSWTPSVTSHSSTGYVYSTTTPDTSATAPSGSPAVYTTWVEVRYTNPMTANGDTNNIYIHHYYIQTGSVTVSGSCGSVYRCASGTRSNSLAAVGSYSTGTVQFPSISDWSIAPPSGTVWIEVRSEAGATQGVPGSTASSSSSGDFSFHP